MNKMQTNKGFTLIEMLVSTAIGAIIVAALFISFVMFQRTYELQREMTRNQESGRMTLDFMVEEIRNAGYRDFNKGSPVPINQAIILKAQSPMQVQVDLSPMIVANKSPLCMIRFLAKMI